MTDSNFDSDKAKMAALAAGIEAVVDEWQQRRDQEIATGKCDHCGSDLSVAWPEGQKDRGEPLIFCGPCFETERSNDQ